MGVGDEPLEDLGLKLECVQGFPRVSRSPDTDKMNELTAMPEDRLAEPRAGRGPSDVAQDVWHEGRQWGWWAGIGMDRSPVCERLSGLRGGAITCARHTHIISTPSREQDSIYA